MHYLCTTYWYWCLSLMRGRKLSKFNTFYFINTIWQWAWNHLSRVIHQPRDQTDAVHFSDYSTSCQLSNESPTIEYNTISNLYSAAIQLVQERYKVTSLTFNVLSSLTLASIPEWLDPGSCFGSAWTIVWCPATFCSENVNWICSVGILGHSSTHQVLKDFGLLPLTLDIVQYTPLTLSRLNMLPENYKIQPWA